MSKIKLSWFSKTMTGPTRIYINNLEKGIVKGNYILLKWSKIHKTLLRGRCVCVTWSLALFVNGNDVDGHWFWVRVLS